jgi:hypothetical protein
VKTCGCGQGTGPRLKKRSDAFPPKKKALALRLKEYKQNCKHRQLQWQLTDEQACLLFQGDCYYCGHKPTTKLNGIDRFRNEQGYTTGNAVSCCRPCNLAKNDQTVEEFMRWIVRTAERIKMLHPKIA